MAEMGDYRIPSTPAINPSRRTAVPDGWWERLDAMEHAENERIRAEAYALMEQGDPAEIEAFVQRGMVILGRVLREQKAKDGSG